jgi:hydrogenase/urease accessory protein HupE
MAARLCLLLLLALSGARPAAAHESLPLVIAITERAENLYAVRVRQPPLIAAQMPPKVRLPAGCTLVQETAMFRCNAGIDGEAISWSYSEPAPAIPVLVRIEWRTGEVRTMMAPPGSHRVTIPRPETAARISLQYFRMGVEHILAGIDHLLFLGCLLWIAGSLRRIVLTVTGFTLAHSLTLALSALSIVHIPIPPTEAAIALSILFLAREIAIGDRASVVWRHPAIVSSLFGLLHGLGFASALREVGLPQTQLLAGLLFFNLGVEAGQLLVVLAAAGAMALARRAAIAGGTGVGRAVERIPAIAVTAIGAISAFWFVERLAGFL